MKTVLLLISILLYLVEFIYGYQLAYCSEVPPTQGDYVMFFLLLAGTITFYVLYLLEGYTRKKRVGSTTVALIDMAAV